MGMLAALLLWIPFAVGFTAVTQDTAPPVDDDFCAIGSVDGKIDRIILTFEANLDSATLFADDFEVVGYVVTGAAMGGQNVVNVTLRVSSETTSDTGATPKVRFFGGNLKFMNGSLVNGGAEVTEVIASDNANPVLDLFYGGLGLKPGKVDSNGDFFNDATNGYHELWASFSEPVDLTNVSLPLACSTPSNPGFAVNPVAEGGNLGSAQFAKFSTSGSCRTNPNAYNTIRLRSDVIANFSLAVKDARANNLQFRRTRFAVSPANPWFVDRYSNDTAFAGGIIMDDATIQLMVGTVPFCSRYNDDCNALEVQVPDCDTSTRPIPAATAYSLDLDGNGKIDHIRVRTQIDRMDVGQTKSLAVSHSAGSVNHTILMRNATFLPRPRIEGYVNTSSQGSWSLPGYNISAVSYGLGQILLTVDEAGTNTSAISAKLNYSSTLLTWTSNEVRVRDVTVIDRACPVLVSAAAWGNANNVTLTFSETVNPFDVIGATFFAGSNFTSAASTAVAMSPSSVSVSLPTRLKYTNFIGPRARFSARPSVSAICPNRRNYVWLDRFDTDPPTVQKVTTQDRNNNGRIDGVRVQLSEAVADESVMASDFNLTGYVNLTFIPGTADDEFLDFSVNELTGVPDGAATPKFSYTAGSLVDTSGNPMASDPNIATQDRVPPVLLKAATRDTTPIDGKIDTLVVFYSENVTVNCSYYSSPTHTVAPFCQVFGSVVTFTFYSPLGAFDGGATPILDYTSGPWGTVDIFGNPAPTTSIQTVDEVLPRAVINGTFTSGPCKLDSISISITEAINTTSVDLTAFSVAGYNITSVQDGGGTPFGFTLKLAQYPPQDPDVVNPNVTYATSVPVKDTHGNPLANFSQIAVDKLLPCLQFCNAKVGRSTITVTMSEPVSTGANQNLTNLNFLLLNVTGASVSTVAKDSNFTYTLTVSRPFNSSEVNFGLSDTRAALQPANIHDGNGNNAAALCYIFNDDFTAPTLSTARTRNMNGDYRLDTIELVFDDLMEDSTFVPSDWSVAGYTVTGWHSGTTPNDDHLYLTIDGPNTTPDTGATPQVNYTKPATGGLTDRGRNLLNGTSVQAVDRAEPVLISAAATILSIANGNNSLVLTFSEPVFPAGSISGNVSAADFKFSNLNGAGASSLAVLLNGDASNRVVSFRLDDLIIADFGQDTISANISDAASNPSNSSAVRLSKGDVVSPTVTSATTGDSNLDGKIDHLSVFFNDSMRNSTFNVTFFHLNGYTLSGFPSVNDKMVDFAVAGSGSLDGDATPFFSYSGGVVADLNDNLLGTFNITTTDGVAPLLWNCSSTLPRLRTIDCLFSEATTNSSAADFVLGGPLGSASITQLTFNGNIVTLHLNRDLVLSDFKNSGTVDLKAMPAVVDRATPPNKGVPSPVTLKNTDTTGAILSSAKSRDTNCNGHIDAVELTWNEGIIDSGVNISHFTIAGFNITGWNTGTTPDDSTIVLVVNEGPSVDVDSTDFSLTYTPGTLTDLSENPVLLISTNVTDGAGPALQTVVADVDTSVVNLTFVSPFSGADLSHFTLVNSSQSLSSILGSVTAGLFLQLGTSVLRPVDFTTPARIISQAQDALGNPSPFCGAVPIRNPDNTPPTMLSIVTADADANGHLDRVVVTCSENINELTLVRTDFVVAGYNVLNVVSGGSMPSPIVIITVGELNSSDVSAQPTVTYTPGSLADRYGNKMGQFTNTSMDGIAPVILSAYGQADSTVLTITFSEPVRGVNNGALNVSDFTYQSASVSAAAQNAVVGLTDADGSDSIVVLQVKNPFQAIDFGRDQIAGLGTIRDVAGNPMGNRGVNITGSVPSPAPADAPPLSQEAIIGIAAGGGALVLLILVAVIVVVFKKRGGKRGGGGFDQNAMMNEFDFGSPQQGTEMAQSSSGANKLEP